MDHEIVNISPASISCGVVELSRVDDDVVKALFAIANHFYHPARGRPPAFAIWSNVVEPDMVNPLCRAVESCRLGTVQRTGAQINPRTGNFIAIWTWEIDHEAFKKWYVARRVERAKRV